MPRTSLNVLDSRIEDRCASIREKHPDWPCARGCDLCCRSLPHLPTVTRAEWERLAPRLSEAQKVRLLEPVGPAPVVCPLLADGACTVYDVRPISCRTYGFYTERDAGLHCAIVTEVAKAREVIWGNGEAIAADLRPYGEVRTLRDWLLGPHTR